MKLNEGETLTAAVRRVVREEVDAGHTPESATSTALKKLTRDQAISLAHPFILSEAKKVARSNVRALEDRAFRPPVDESAEPSERAYEERPAPFMPPGEWRRALWDECFSLADGTLVKWGEATAEQHEARAAEQRRLSITTGMDADRHEWAAKTIRDAGVDCLNDIEDAA